MPEIVRCPRCERKLRIAPELAGKNVKCPTCGATFLPNGGAPPAPDLAAAPPDAAGQAAPQQAAGQERAYAPVRPAEYAPHRGMLILIFGILGLVVCNVFAPIAWIMGNGDLKEIRAGRMDPEGESLTNVGRILGIVGTILTVLSLCGVLVIVVIAILAALAKGGH
jgi:hypothetical protein